MRSTFLAFSPPLIAEDEIDEVLDTLRSDWITTGPKAKRFEQEFAMRVNAEHALAVFSCTDALQVALAALGIGPGDAVFTTTYTFCATVHVIEHLGATPCLVDVEPDSLNISPTALREAIVQVVAAGTLTPRAIMPVHYAGAPCDMLAIDQIAAEFGLAIVEDAAHALPAVVDGRIIGDPTAPAGVIRATAFSFYATKNLTTGEGGMLTGPASFIEEARLWALHGMSRDAWNRYGKGGSWYYEVVRPGFKCNMTDIQASLGIRQLAKLDKFRQHREELVHCYQEGLDDVLEVQRPSVPENSASAWHLYPIRLNLEQLTIDRAAFIDKLSELNIGASVHFIPVHTHPYYRNKYSFTNEQFPIAWQQYQRLISLPLNLRMSIDDVQDVVDAVKDVVARSRR
jgi:dTDP-4-amino-4,6-dideoxygalactose transaminase